MNYQPIMVIDLKAKVISRPFHLLKNVSIYKIEIPDLHKAINVPTFKSRMIYPLKFMNKKDLLFMLGFLEDMLEAIFISANH
jgi:hypothetical protein